MIPNKVAHVLRGRAFTAEQLFRADILQEDVVVPQAELRESLEHEEEEQALLREEGPRLLLLEQKDEQDFVGLISLDKAVLGQLSLHEAGGELERGQALPMEQAEGVLLVQELFEHADELLLGQQEEEAVLEQVFAKKSSEQVLVGQTREVCLGQVVLGQTGTISQEERLRVEAQGQLGDAARLHTDGGVPQEVRLGVAALVQVFLGQTIEPLVGQVNLGHAGGLSQEVRFGHAVTGQALFGHLGEVSTGQAFLEQREEVSQEVRFPALEQALLGHAEEVLQDVGFGQAATEQALFGQLIVGQVFLAQREEVSQEERL
ncbi:hypothetical protein NDU88_000841 [Pleurodeles waltl]|uniref:Uncharacterized protein n=1 Tax=Pleurodeles waltl TaxID=8319 RepID=A0AAV7Q5C3_PLEWA|nr:hypothetical protein NDU88_000841 [Pleurodeles waltl]